MLVWLVIAGYYSAGDRFAGLRAVRAAYLDTGLSRVNFPDFKINDFTINTDSILIKSKNVVGYFLHGLKLKSYTFEKYKTKKIKKIFQ